ncbi:PAS domain S-box protein, partial [Candidatus Bathyarchaeota archaeon]
LAANAGNALIKIKNLNTVEQSEAHLKAIFDLAGFILVVLDKQGNISSINQYGAELLGYRKEELLGRNWFDTVLLKDDRERIRKVQQSILAGDATLNIIEDKVITKKGEILDIRWYNDILKDPEGSLVSTVSSGVDITEKKREEEILRSMEALYAPLINPDSTMLDITVKVLEQARALTHSIHGYVSEVDPETGDNIGHTHTFPMEICRVPDFKATFPRNPDGTYNGLWGHTLNTKKSFFTNNPEKFEDSVGIPENHIPLHNFLSVPVLLGEILVGQICLANAPRDFNQKDVEGIEKLADIYALAIHRIRTEKERDRVQQQLILEKSRAEQAEEMDRVKSNLMNTATHEIRTPLTSILGYSELIREKLEEMDSKLLLNYFDVLERNVKRLDILSSDLLDLQRIELGRMGLNKSIVSVNKILSGIEAEMTPILNGKEQKIEIINQASNLEINLDEIRITQVLVNLIGNSSKFSPNSSKIQLNIEKVDENAVFTIKDNGIGLSEDDITKLFNPFPDIRVQNAEHGSGLGLSICKGIIELHGGKIKVESEGRGKGSTFSFYIPLN